MTRQPASPRRSSLQDDLACVVALGDHADQPPSSITSRPMPCWPFDGLVNRGPGHEEDLRLVPDDARDRVHHRRLRAEPACRVHPAYAVARGAVMVQTDAATCNRSASGRNGSWASGRGRRSRGFASGTVDGIRTRRYQASLTAVAAHRSCRAGQRLRGLARDASGQRRPHVAAVRARRRPSRRRQPHRDVHPDPWRRILGLPDGNRIEHQVLVPRRQAATVSPGGCAGPGGPRGTPLVSARFHALHHENPAFRFDADVAGRRIVWRPYPGLPAMWRARTAATHTSRTGTELPLHRGASARARLRRGPGITRTFAGTWRAAKVLILAADGHEPAGDVEAIRVAEGEAPGRFASRPPRRGCVRRAPERQDGDRRLPWFTDWGRDADRAARLCLATGRFDDARSSSNGAGGLRRHAAQLLP